MSVLFDIGVVRYRCCSISGPSCESMAKAATV